MTLREIRNGPLAGLAYVGRCAGQWSGALQAALLRITTLEQQLAAVDAPE